MKKLLLLAAFGVAGLVSANGLVKETSLKVETVKVETVKEETVNKTKVATSCTPVTYSCGVSGWACGETTLEMLINAWDGDSLFCG